jgi:hypothetical protein
LASHLPRADWVSAIYDEFTSLPQIADDEERADVLQRLTPLLPLELVREALKTAAAIADSRQRAEVIKALLARLPESERAEALRTTGLLTALGIPLGMILNELATSIVPVDRLIPLWSDVLHVAATESRSALLTDLAALAPFIANAQAAGAVFTAIRTVGRWWP